ncbi:MAG: hypothetical protein D6731_25490 [Planctomycetota bacterium]|nr:MAG: hypothetical protein D6731_25490 [Planctomycetota bacterium]
MSDARARRIERAAAAGDPAPRAQALAVRIRGGSLPLGRVRLAARLGDDAARAVLGAPPAARLPQWLGAEAPWDPSVLARVALSLAEAVYPVWWPGDPNTPPPWTLASGTEPAWLALRLLEQRVLAAAPLPDPAERTALERAREGVLSAVREATGRRREEVRFAGRAVAWAAGTAALLGAPEAADAAVACSIMALEARSERELLASLRADLLPWLLDGRCPLRDRSSPQLRWLAGVAHRTPSAYGR